MSASDRELIDFVYAEARMLDELRFEDWLAMRASARALYRMDDQALSDLALSQSDVERVNRSARKAPWRQ